jgi:hypothetical protein
MEPGKERRPLDARLHALHDEARGECVSHRVIRQRTIRVEPEEVEIERRAA